MPDLNTLARWTRRALTLPPHVVLAKATHKAAAAYARLRERRLDVRQPTYLTTSEPRSELYHYFSLPPVEILRNHADWVAGVGEHYLEHRFDLLGSGWTSVRHGMPCRGLEGHRYNSGPERRSDPAGLWLRSLINPANGPQSQRIWRLVGAGYTPIDWQLDFKSGYRWSERTWYAELTYGRLPGVDVKVPWELARMQHLSQLALAFALARAGCANFRSADAYAAEFRNQVLDFIATNPPRFGVNWSMTMDVAIRIVNWLVAYDLFRAAGAGFDPEFETVLRRSVVEHGIHIAGNLEWSPALHGNHYLANVVGLLFVAAYLPRSALVDAWLAFGVQELLAEMEGQFTPDGANFEASTCYHRLAAEHVVYATALVLGLPSEKLDALGEYDHRVLATEPPLRPPPIAVRPLDGHRGVSPLPPWYFERLERMAEFVVDLTKPNGRVPQIGDNDSGRLLKLQPILTPRVVAEARQFYVSLDGYDGLPETATYWEENHLDHRPLVAAINGIFGREDFREFTGTEMYEEHIVRAAGRASRIPSYRNTPDRGGAEIVRIGERGDLDALILRLSALPAACRRSVRIPLPHGVVLEGLCRRGYPEFGVYVFRSPRLFLAVRCGPPGQNGFGGHAHNDQLSIELNVEGEDRITDPGTYLYTPLPAQRNAYRSVHAHFAPAPSCGEPAGLDRGPFILADPGTAECLYFGDSGFGGRVTYGWGVMHAIITLTDTSVAASYFLEGDSFADSRTDDWQAWLPAVPFSPGYGQILRDSTGVPRQPVASAESAG